MFNISCTCDNLICMFSVFFSMSHFKVRENEIVGGGIKVVKFNLFSSTLRISYLKTPENLIVGAGVSYLCKITASRAPAASQMTFSSSVVFLFPPQNTRKCRCGVLVFCSIHAHVQHLMHLRRSDLRVFSFYFPCPTSRFGKTKLWVVLSRL